MVHMEGEHRQGEPDDQKGHQDHHHDRQQRHHDARGIRRLGRGDGHLLRGLHLIERVHKVLPFPRLAAGKAAIEVLGAVHFALFGDALRYRGK